MKPRQHGRRRRVHLEPESDLNITAFLNLMVVLLPFLLTTAVFSRLAILAVEVPTPGPRPEVALPPPAPPTSGYTLALRLEEGAVLVRSGEVTLPPIPRTATGAYDTARLTAVLAAIKAEHPEHDAVDLYARPDTPYAELVAVMDAASFRPEGGALFADVRLGEIRP